MNDKVNPESLGQARPAFDTRKYVRRIMDSGMPEGQADVLVELLNASLENAVTKDDLKHRLDGLESAVKSYSDKLSKGDRKFFVQYAIKLVGQLRTDVNARFGDVYSRLDATNARADALINRMDNFIDQLAESDRRKDKRARDIRKFIAWVFGVAAALAAIWYYLTYILNV